MSDVIIRVEKLSKRYKIGKRERYKALRDTLTDIVAAPLNAARAAFQRATKPVEQTNDEQFWALKDISFEVKRGEVVGIIGRNGAGKSTLLKILSRITRPTEGRVGMRGRVGSLLEVGTGFHPELSGRENILLNGAILGMGRAEILRKFDEILAFAEVEKFIDTPVKHYSSGMYMRLAFSVAAHLEPEILVVDEVLAVGDAAFQKKCLGKMGDVAKEGRTVLFVSHNMGAVTQLCQHGIVLAGGKKIFEGTAAAAVDLYLKTGKQAIAQAEFAIDRAMAKQFTAIRVETTAGEMVSQLDVAQPFVVRVAYRVTQWRLGTYICIAVTNQAGLDVLWSSDARSTQDLLVDRPPGDYVVSVEIPGSVLAPGLYSCSVAMYAPGNQDYDYRENAVGFEIVDTDSLLSQFGIAHPAVTVVPLTWRKKHVDI